MEDPAAEVIYAKNVDDTGSMHMCSKGDDGAVAYIRVDIANFAMCSGRSHGEALEVMNEY